MNKLILFPVLALFLSGCTWFTKTEYISVREEIPIIHPSTPTPLALENVDLKVWNKQRLQEAAAQATEDTVYFVLEPEEARKLGRNLTNIASSMAQYRNLLDYYKTSLRDYNSRIREEKLKLEE